MEICKDIYYVGVNDQALDLFEGQYPLKQGVTYNSYVIKDEKIVIMDTVDKRAQDIWMENIEEVLKDREPDYLVVSHMEPDHGACIQVLAEKYPNIQIVGNMKTFQMIDQFFCLDSQIKRIQVKEGDTLSLGRYTLQFMMAPMVHWPEVMMSYLVEAKLVFSADAFGTFNDDQNPWVEEARRYYSNIVGKYGLQVQNVLKKLKGLDIETICPLHGPVLKENLMQYLRYYQLWSSYQSEEAGVLIVCASIHGHTYEAAQFLKAELEKHGEKVILRNLCHEDISEVIGDAFCYDRLVLAASSYDGGVFAPMDDFLHHLKNKNFQNRPVAYIENGSWAPCATRTMKDITSTMKNMGDLGNVTIKGAMKKADEDNLIQLALAIMEEGCLDEACM